MNIKKKDITNCKPCSEKSKKIEEVSNNRLLINCLCGLQRLIPPGLKIGQEFTLVPCPKCGSPFVGKLIGSYVEAK